MCLSGLGLEEERDCRVAFKTSEFSDCLRDLWNLNLFVHSHIHTILSALLCLRQKQLLNDISFVTRLTFQSTLRQKTRSVLSIVPAPPEVRPPKFLNR